MYFCIRFLFLFNMNIIFFKFKKLPNPFYKSIKFGLRDEVTRWRKRGLLTGEKLQNNFSDWTWRKLLQWFIEYMTECPHFKSWSFFILSKVNHLISKNTITTIYISLSLYTVNVQKKNLIVVFLLQKIHMRTRIMIIVLMLKAFSLDSNMFRFSSFCHLLITVDKSIYEFIDEFFFFS